MIDPSRPLAGHRRATLPIRVLLAVLLLGLAQAPALAAGAPADLAELRETALDLLNRDREAQGLAPLALADDLNGAAQFHAEDMLARGYFEHASPEGRTASDRYQAEGGAGWRLIAENIAQCTGCRVPVERERLAAFEAGWMQSPQHRANILRQGVDRFGYGIAAEGDRAVAVQTFSGPGQSIGQPDGQPMRPVTLGQARLLLLETVNAARGQRDLPMLAESRVLDQVGAALLPEPGGAASLPSDRLETTLPADERERWTVLAASSAGCSGCGATIDVADVRWLSSRWLEGGTSGDALLNPDMSHLGFAAGADGEGRKTAVAVVGGLRVTP